MGDLLDDTAVQGGSGEYTARVMEDWSAFGPNGGYLSAIALRAAGAESRFARPASYGCHYLGPAAFGPVRLSVQRVFGNARAESLRVSMTQHERPILDATVWAIGPIASGFDDHDGMEMPPSPTIESLNDNQPEWEKLAAPSVPSSRLTFWKNLDQRFIGFQGWGTPGEPKLDGWYRYRPRPTMPDAFADAGRSLILIDSTTWLAAMNPYMSRARIVAPTMELTARFYHPASTEWLRCRARSDIAFGGLIDGSAEVWSHEGKMVARGDCQMLYRASGRVPAGAVA